MFKKKWVRNLCIVIGVLVGLYLALFIVNVFMNLSLRNYIKSFEPVSYTENRIVPVMEDGYMTITTDRDLKIMHITDIHIGGGVWSYKNDKKSIYELISMLQKEQPDIAILGGDNTYCVPGFGFNGGFTFNNKMTAKTVISIFDHEQVYFSTVFGNHDTEAFDYADRQTIGDLYMSDYSEYCFFEQNFTDLDAATVPSVSNQFVVVKNTSGEITKLLLLIDSNAYENTGFIASAKGKYDVIHDAQIEWAQDTITEFSKKAGLPEGEYLKTICFVHIPMGEYRVAIDDLITEIKNDEGKIVSYEQNANPSGDTVFVEGVWDESICYGGRNLEGIAPQDADNFFEVLCDEMNTVEAVFCGHDHVNSGVVMYKGVMLAYGYSIDNEAYGNKIRYSGSQRGATVITLHNDGSFEQKHKNAYKDYGISTTEFFDVYLDHPLYEKDFRTVTR